MNDLDLAIRLATQAHENQFDKGGFPYILHPLRVMFYYDKMSLSCIDDEEYKIVAVLHDVIEDSKMTLDDLKYLGFAHPVLDAIDSLTRRENEKYFKYICRIGHNKLATIVKIADLKDNLDVTRLKSFTEKDRKRTEKYMEAIRILTNWCTE